MKSKVRIIYSFETIEECITKIKELGVDFDIYVYNQLVKQSFFQVGTSDSVLVFFDPFKLLD